MDILSALALIIIPIVLIVVLARILDGRRYNKGIGEPPAGANKIGFIILGGMVLVGLIIFSFLNGGLDTLNGSLNYVQFIITFLALLLLGLLALRQLRKWLQGK